MPEALIEPSIQMWMTFGVVVAAILAYTSDRIPLEISCFTTVAVLLLMFHLVPLTDAEGVRLITTRDLLAGFADPALITIMALLVVGQGLVQTGALHTPAGWLVALADRAPNQVFLFSFLFVMFVSAVMNNTPVVVMFIPILAALSERLGKRAATVMMPLSFVAILGGNLTLIGSSTNLLAVGAYTQLGGANFSFFQFTIPGLLVAGAGFIYVAFIMPRFLGKSAGQAEAASSASGKQFIFQLELEADSRLIGEEAVSGLFPGLKDLTVRMIERGGMRLLPPYDKVKLQEGDVIVAAATRGAVMGIVNASKTSIASAEGDVDEDAENGSGRRLVAEAVIAPASRMDGRTIAQTGFRADTGCTVLGVQRRSRMIRAALSQLRLEAGDVLLVMGSRPNILGLRDNRDVLLMESSTADVPMTEYASRAQLIFLVIVALASSGLMPISITALGGAMLMLTTGCLNIRQASRAIDRRVFAVVGAALALGTAMQTTGGAQYMGQTLVSLLAGAPTTVILSGFFLLIALLTNVLSNNATAVLFTPVAVSLSQSLGADPMPFLLAVIFGANCSFATPMGYQTNLLVMGPGNYTFNDYVRAGAPLIFIVWMAFTIVIPWYYGV